MHYSNLFRIFFVALIALLLGDNLFADDIYPVNPINSTVTLPCPNSINFNQSYASNICNGNVSAFIPIPNPSSGAFINLGLAYSSINAGKFDLGRNNSDQKMFGDSWELTGMGLEFYIETLVNGKLRLHSHSGTYVDFALSGDIYRPEDDSVSYLIKGGSTLILADGVSVFFRGVTGFPGKLFPSSFNINGKSIGIYYNSAGRNRPQISKISSNVFKGGYWEINFIYTDGKVTSIANLSGDAFAFQYDEFSRLVAVSLPVRGKYPGYNKKSVIDYVSNTNLVSYYTPAGLPCHKSGLYFQYYSNPPGTISSVYELVYQNKNNGAGRGKDESVKANYEPSLKKILNFNFNSDFVESEDFVSGNLYKEKFDQYGVYEIELNKYKTLIDRIKVSSSRAFKYPATVRTFLEDNLIEQTDYVYKTSTNFPPLVQNIYYKSLEDEFSYTEEFQYNVTQLTNSKYFKPALEVPANRDSSPLLFTGAQDEFQYAYDSSNNIQSITFKNHFKKVSRYDYIRNAAGLITEFRYTYDNILLEKMTYDANNGDLIKHENFSDGEIVDYTRPNQNVAKVHSNIGGYSDYSYDYALREIHARDGLYEVKVRYDNTGGLQSYRMTGPNVDNSYIAPDSESACPLKVKFLKSCVPSGKCY